MIEEFSRCYVAASGKNFPHTLKPLMESHGGVMFNPDRPMVMYESMSLALTQLENPNPDLELNNADLEVAGKRGNVTLEYNLQSSGKTVGEVAKRLLLGGLESTALSHGRHHRGVLPAQGERHPLGGDGKR